MLSGVVEAVRRFRFDEIAQEIAQETIRIWIQK